VYERAGLSDRLDLVGAPAPDRTYDLVLSFNALAGPEWREDLARTLARANGTAIVVVTNRSSWGVGLRRVARLFETGREVEPWEHEATRPEVVEPELRLAGRIADRAWLDCPWWPDLFVTSGETLVGATLRRIGIDRPTRSKLRFGAESFPFTRGALDPALARALALHPGFDGVDARWVRRFAHHRAYRVEVTRGPGTGTTRPSP
jgi:hypothetical protein